MEEHLIRDTTRLICWTESTALGSQDKVLYKVRTGLNIVRWIQKK